MNDKKQLRLYYKDLRRKMSLSEKKTFDKKITNSFLESDLYRDCDGLLAYVSFDIEVDTRSIIKHAIKEKAVYCPRCVPGTSTMEFYRIHSFDDLVCGSYDILEPDMCLVPQKSFSNRSVCIVPGLSFDSRGYRLGFGKGYYDRFLCDFKGVKAGICYQSFLCDSLPTDKYDICVDYLITEKRSYDFGMRKEEIYGK